MTDVVLIRHAQSVWNAAGRWQGWADPPLSDLGERQAAGAARLLQEIVQPVALASSDLQRARRSAEVLRSGLPGAASNVAIPAMVDPDLREYDAGAWTGLRRDEIAQRWPGRLEDWATGRGPGPPDGEDPDGFLARLWDALRRLEVAVPEGAVVVVSHGRAIHALATDLGAPARRIEHLSGWRLRLDAHPELVAPVTLLDPSLTDDGPSEKARRSHSPDARRPPDDGRGPEVQEL